MMRRALAIGLAAMTLALMSVVPAFSQEAASDEGNEHPIFDLLALIPDNESTRASIVYYTDWRAAETILPTIQTPENFAQWDGWVWPYMRIISEPSFQFLIEYDRTPEVVGMDFFDIDRTLYAGMPPSNTFIYAGEFDTAAISATLSDRDESANGAGQYEQAEINGVDAWCWVDGCDQGLTIDMMGRDPANLLDPGALGRNPPIFLTDSTITFSFDLATMESVADVINGNAHSLAEADDFHALAEAVTDDELIPGALVQAHFIQPRDAYYALDFNDLESGKVVLGPRITEEALKELAQAEEFAAYGTLPPYQMAVIADHQGDDGEQFASIGLVYTSEAEAQMAADELATRLVSYRDVLMRGPDGMPFFENLQGTMSPQVSESSTGQFVALVSVSYPIPDYEATPASPPGLLFRAWVQGIVRRAFYPLWDVVLPE